LERVEGANDAAHGNFMEIFNSSCTVEKETTANQRWGRTGISESACYHWLFTEKVQKKRYAQHCVHQHVT